MDRFLPLKQRLNHSILYKRIANWCHRQAIIKNPQKEANRCFRMYFDRDIDWENPKGLIDKTYWMLLHTDTSEWTRCADKYLVRDYLKECSLEHLLVPLFGKWDNADDIDFDALPNQFVIKTNHSCGTNIVVTNKNTIDIEASRKKLKEWLSIPYGYSGMQLHYTKITPCIIAEKLLTNDELSKSVSPNSLIDYKVWCINGHAESILVVYDRRHDRYCLDLYDLDWNKKRDCLRSLDVFDIEIRDTDIPKPNCLIDMINAAETLSKPFLAVRVDFYVLNNKLYFGELTFTPGLANFTEDYYNYLGSKIDLSKVKKIK